MCLCLELISSVSITCLLGIMESRVYFIFFNLAPYPSNYIRLYVDILMVESDYPTDLGSMLVTSER